MKMNSMYMIGAAMTGLMLVGNAAQAASDPNESITVTAGSQRDFNLKGSDFKSEMVNYSQHDLVRDGSYGRLVARISSVAGRLCDYVSKTDIWNLDQRQTCINAAVSDARRQIDNPNAKRMAYAEQSVVDVAPVLD